jgi:hypothetical protein
MTPPPLSRGRIATCILVNLGATPGLGSLWARRPIAGTFQLILALIGFFLIMGWMLMAVWTAVSQQVNDTHAAPPPGWMWKWGLVIFGVSWLWSLVTSISLWRQSKPKNVPPRLPD